MLELISAEKKIETLALLSLRRITRSGHSALVCAYSFFCHALANLANEMLNNPRRLLANRLQRPLHYQHVVGIISQPEAKDQSL